MRIEKIRLTNYRGFKDCSIEFHPTLNIFIGSNAAGKSSLLWAIAKIFSSITSSHTHAPATGLVISADDIHYEATSCTVVAWAKDFPGYKGDIPLVLNTDREISKSDEFVRMHHQRQDFANSLSQMVHEGPMTLPIFKFYPADRGFIKVGASRTMTVYPIPQIEAWSNIIANSVSYGRFFQWFSDSEISELRLQRDAQDFSIQNPALKDVRTALAKVFDLMGYNNIKLKVEEMSRAGNARPVQTLVLSDGDGKQERLDNKSDGEKALITLVADISYNLSLAKSFAAGSSDFLTSPGIVLIDEIETHLHPNWQRKFIEFLVKIFPNIQFFITTHSPQVVASVKSESVFSMEAFTVHNMNLKTFGEDSNSLLTRVFNATERPVEYMRLIEKFDQLIESNAEPDKLRTVIDQVRRKEDIDKGDDISDIVGYLSLRLEAYEFDREHEENK